MQEPQRVIEGVREHRASDLVIWPSRANASLRGLQIPVGDVIPHKPSRRLRVFAQAETRVPVPRWPRSINRSRWAKRGIALDDCGVQPAEYPLIGECHLAVAQLVDASYRRATDVRQQEAPDVPQLGR